MKASRARAIAVIASAGFAGALAPAPASVASAAEGSPSMSLRGRIFTDVYAPLTEVSQKSLNFVGTSAWLVADPKLDEDTSARLILETNLTESSGSGGDADTLIAQVTLREAYASYSRGSWDLRFGRQIIPWGKSDGINPTDFLGAKDFRRFNPDDEIKRIGGTALKAAFTPDQGASPLTVTAVWQPVFPRSRFLVAPESVPASVVFLNDQFPTRNLTNSELALRATYFTPGWDLSLTGFHGWNHLPEYAFAQINSSAQVEIAPNYHRIRAVGFDFSKTFSEWILRLESAYTWTENDAGINPVIEPSHFDSVLGLEKTFGEYVRLQVQGILRYHPSYSPPSEASGATPLVENINRQVAALNALLQGYQLQRREGASFRLAYTNEKAGWEVEGAAVGYFESRDYLLRPKVTRSFTDTFKASVGLDFYGGPEDTQFGALHYYNSLYFEAKYSF